MMKTRTCAVSGQSFVVRDEDLAFYKKVGVPIPTLCPAERMRRRLQWRNDRHLYRRTCDGTKQSIVTHHHEDNPYPVYHNRHWWSDAWDPTSFGRDFDFNRPFFEQFKDLHNVVPQLAIMNDDGQNSENCLYCDDFAFGKNCYLVTGSWRVQDSMYSDNVNHGSEIYDCLSVNLQCELCYRCTDSQHLYHCGFLSLSSHCSDCFFGEDLIGCRHCFGCVGLRQKEYHIYNKPYSQAEYEDQMRKIDRGSFDQLAHLQAYFEQHRKGCSVKAFSQQRCEESTGDQLFGCKGMWECFDYFNGEDCAYSWKGDGGKHSYDFYQSGNPQWCYDNITPDDSYQVHFSIFTWKTKDSYYCDTCQSSENLFGCIGLRRAKHCLLNKSYTKQEYDELIKKIIQYTKETGEFGEFFPGALSPYAYNESVAQEFFPMTKEEAQKRGYNWKEEAGDSPLSIRGDKGGIEKDSVNATTPQPPPILGGEAPASIAETPDSICDQVLHCESSGKPYKIQKAELGFYRKMGWPIPRKCPIQRYRELMRGRPGKQLYDRSCDQCGETIQTVYGPDFERKVLCEKCYREVVV